MHTKLLNIILPAVLAIVSILPCRANLPGTWSYISAFNPNTTLTGSSTPVHVRKIIDGPKYCYFLVHSQPYKRSVIDGTSAREASQNLSVLFRADNTREVSLDTPAEIEAVASLPGVGGVIVNNAEYCPEAGCLAVAYDNGNVSLLFDNGEVETIGDLKNMNFPGLKEIHSLTWDTDNNRLYIAGFFGFAEIDVEKRRLKDICLSHLPLELAFRCGDRMLAVTAHEYRRLDNKDQAVGGMVYEAPYSKAFEGWKNFTELEVDVASSVFGETDSDKNTNKPAIIEGTHLVQAAWAVPFNESTVCLLSQLNTSRKCSLLSLGSDGKWRVLWVFNPTVNYEPLNGSIMAFLEGNTTRCDVGWAMISWRSYMKFNRTVKPDFSASKPVADYKSRAVETRQVFPADGVTAFNSRRFSSYDGSTAWVYNYFEGFRKIGADAATGNWSNLSANSLPDAPVACYTSNLGWGAGTGLVVRQFGNDHLFSDIGNEKDHVSVRRNGIWEDFSMRKTNPDLTGGYFIPNGVAADPLNPGYVYSGSRYCGLIRRNVNDPADVMILGCSGEGSKNANLPGFVDAFPFQPSWKGLCWVDAPRFDDEGNLWMPYSDFSNNDMVIYKWSKEAIAASKNAHKDASAYVPMQHWSTGEKGVTVPSCYFPISGNRGFLNVGNRGETIFFLDFSDPAGMVKKTLDGKRSEDGTIMENWSLHPLCQNPKNGRIWLGGDNGLMWIDEADLTKETIPFHHGTTTFAKGTSNRGNFGESLKIHAMALDCDNRLWVATKGGVICISADGEETIAQFDCTNSPMGNPEVTAITYDGDAKSIVMSTAEGLYEFKPSQWKDPAQVEKLTVIPAAVTPGYNGWITLSGVPDSMKLSLQDKDGNIYCELPAAAGGMVQWDGRKAGTKAPAGRYKVVEQGTNRTLAEITVY